MQTVAALFVLVITRNGLTQAHCREGVAELPCPEPGTGDQLSERPDPRRPLCDTSLSPSGTVVVTWGSAGQQETGGLQGPRWPPRLRLAAVLELRPLGEAS